MPLSSLEIATVIRSKINQDQKIAFVSGNFNVIHPGHLRLLKFASDCADVLIVGVNKQDSPGAHLSEDLRLESVKALGLVEHTFIVPGKLEKLLEFLKPDFVVKGKEHENTENCEKEIVESYGGSLVFSSGEVFFSSMDLLMQESHLYAGISTPFVKQFFERHTISNDNLQKIINKFKDIRVLVIGDLIVDEYIICDALGMSQEDPTIVVAPSSSSFFIGGAGIVAAHASGMGAQATLYSISGDDELSAYAKEKIESYGVAAKLFSDPSRPTTKKQRFRTENKTHLRVNYLKQHDIDLALQKKIFGEIEPALENVDLVIFSDFSYGCLPQSLVQQISQACKKRGISMVADSQSSSQIGDISRFKEMLLLKPTEREARLATRDFGSGLVVLAEKLKKIAKPRNILLTLGSEGLLICHGTDPSGDNTTDRIPALNNYPKDPAGAGDSLLVSAAMSLAVGADIWSAAYIASLVSATQVSRIGNVPITADELLKIISV